jgi:AraC family transcriptional regulator
MWRGQRGGSSLISHIMNKQPIFQTREAFTVVGVERYTSNGIPAIQEAWGEFSKRSNEIQNIVAPIAFGVEDYSRDFEMNPGGFPKYYYISSYEVSSTANIPEGMKAKEIAAGNYAVFIFEGSLAELPKFFTFIYGEWMPASGYKMDPALSLDFERYPEPVTDMHNAKVEIWVPVVKA